MLQGCLWKNWATDPKDDQGVFAFITLSITHLITCATGYEQLNGPLQWARLNQRCHSALFKTSSAKSDSSMNDDFSLEMPSKILPHLLNFAHVLHEKSSRQQTLAVLLLFFCCPFFVAEFCKKAEVLCWGGNASTLSLALQKNFEGSPNKCQKGDFRSWSVNLRFVWWWSMIHINKPPMFDGELTSG